MNNHRCNKMPLVLGLLGLAGLCALFLKKEHLCKSKDCCKEESEESDDPEEAKEGSEGPAMRKTE